MAEFKKPSNWSYGIISDPSNSSLYSGVGWSSGTWSYDSYPYLKITLNQYKPYDKTYSFVDFKWFSKVQQTTASSFSSVGWDSNVWQLSSRPTLSINLKPYVPYERIGSFVDSNRYSKITNPDSYSKHPYSSVSWDMERIWVIQEGANRPRLINRIVPDLGVPLTHNMTYTYVVPHIKGTMNYMGVTWKSRGYFFTLPKPPAQGFLNQEVTYSVPDSDLRQRINSSYDGNIDVVFLASGVRDTLGAGGFGTYNDEKSRTIKVGNVASATVNFYFTQPHMIPSRNYKVCISTPEGILNVGARSDADIAVIRFTVSPGFNMGLELVSPNHNRATNIHVMTEHGVMALASWDEYNSPIMEVD